MLAACHAPSTHLDNPGRHTCYLDGVQETRDEVPFRFYGTSRVDVIPAAGTASDGGDAMAEPDFDHQPTSILVTTPVPASRWLFPLDFVLEAVGRIVAPPPDQRVAVAPAPTPPEQVTEPGVRPAGLDALGQRAAAARTWR